MIHCETPCNEIPLKLSRADRARSKLVRVAAVQFDSAAYPCSKIAKGSDFLNCQVKAEI
jgi:hypothetical protein